MKKSLVIAVVLGIVTSAFFYFSNFYRKRPRVVFCNVGQGDAIYIRLPAGQDVLIDAGPNRAVLSCLNNHLPYFDRQLELVFITHAQKDHAGGLIYILDNFEVKQLFTTAFSQQQSAQFWQELLTRLEQEKLTFEYLERGDKLILNYAELLVLWPPAKSSKVLYSGAEYFKKNLNNYALGILALVKDKQILLLSDLDTASAEKALEGLKLSANVLKINHHGSKYATNQKLLQLADPGLAVISAGANNLYGHPAPQVLQLLQSLDIPIRRTDIEGDVVILLE